MTMEGASTNLTFVMLGLDEDKRSEVVPSKHKQFPA